MKQFLVAILLLVALAQCQGTRPLTIVNKDTKVDTDYLVWSGDFAMIFVDETTNKTVHAASIVAYDPSTDKFENIFNGGGVLEAAYDSALVNVLTSTPL